MIAFRQKGDWSKSTNFLKRIKQRSYLKVLDQYGRRGVEALSSATPVDTGKTAGSWYYKISINNNRSTITFCNSNINNGVPIAIILQYGHGTRNGGYVQGRDYINPAIQPIFDQLTKDAWGEVTKV